MNKHAIVSRPDDSSCVAALADPFCRDFMRILDAAASFFERVTTDEANHLADGIFCTCAGRGYKALFSYDGPRRLATLVIVFSGVHLTTLEQLRTLSRIQAAIPLAKLDPDDEEHLLKLVATSVCPDPSTAEPVMNEIGKSLRQALADSRLQSFL